MDYLENLALSYRLSVYNWFRSGHIVREGGGRRLRWGVDLLISDEKKFQMLFKSLCYSLGFLRFVRLFSKNSLYGHSRQS